MHFRKLQRAVQSRPTSSTFSSSSSLLDGSSSSRPASSSSPLLARSLSTDLEELDPLDEPHAVFVLKDVIETDLLAARVLDRRPPHLRDDGEQHRKRMKGKRKK